MTYCYCTVSWLCALISNTAVKEAGDGLCFHENMLLMAVFDV